MLPLCPHVSLQDGRVCVDNSDFLPPWGPKPAALSPLSPTNWFLAAKCDSDPSLGTPFMARVRSQFAHMWALKMTTIMFPFLVSSR